MAVIMQLHPPVYAGRAMHCVSSVTVPLTALAVRLVSRPWSSQRVYPPALCGYLIVVMMMRNQWLGAPPALQPARLGTNRVIDVMLIVRGGGPPAVVVILMIMGVFPPAIHGKVRLIKQMTWRGVVRL